MLIFDVWGCTWTMFEEVSADSVNLGSEDRDCNNHIAPRKDNNLVLTYFILEGENCLTS